MNVQGPGSSWSDVGGNITLGMNGSGSLSVSDGATVSVNALSAATGLGSSAAITVSGAGSKLTSQGSILPGAADGGTATLLVENGAALETVGGHNPPTEPGGSLYIAQANVLITGAGTSVRIGTRDSGTPDDWDHADGWFSVGNGMVLVSNGAFLESDGGYVEGTVTGGVAIMMVSGTGTVWDAHLCLYVGGNGNGTAGNGGLLISDGAQVITTIAAAGTDAGTTGVILLTGAGSSLTVVPHAAFLGNAYAGNGGEGYIVVQEDATLSVAKQLRIGYADTSTGVLAIGAMEGTAATAPGTVTTGAGIVFGDGSATHRATPERRLYRRHRTGIRRSGLLASWPRRSISSRSRAWPM